MSLNNKTNTISNNCPIEVMRNCLADLVTKKDSATTHHTSADHHSSQNPQEAHLQRTIQHHRNSIHTLQKDLTSDDPDTLTYHRNKLTQSQEALDKLKKSKKT